MSPLQQTTTSTDPHNNSTEFNIDSSETSGNQNQQKTNESLPHTGNDNRTTVQRRLFDGNSDTTDPSIKQSGSGLETPVPLGKNSQNSGIFSQKSGLFNFQPTSANPKSPTYGSQYPDHNKPTTLGSLLRDTSSDANKSPLFSLLKNNESNPSANVSNSFFSGVPLNNDKQSSIFNFSNSSFSSGLGPGYFSDVGNQKPPLFSSATPVESVLTTQKPKPLFSAINPTPALSGLLPSNTNNDDTTVPGNNMNVESVMQKLESDKTIDLQSSQFPSMTGVFNNGGDNQKNLLFSKQTTSIESPTIDHTSKPFFSAINPISTTPNILSKSNNDNGISTILSLGTPIATNNVNSEPEDIADTGTALGHLKKISSGMTLKLEDETICTNTHSSALGKLNSLFAPSPIPETSPVNITQQNHNPLSLMGEEKSILFPNIQNSSSNNNNNSVLKNELFTNNQSFSTGINLAGMGLPLEALVTSKPIISNSSEFNYTLPEYLSQPNSSYVKDYVVPKLGSIEEITKKLASSHIENKSQLDTLDKLSPNIIDLIQNKDLYYGQGQFRDMNLKPELMRGLFEMGYRIPSRIQEATLPIIVSQRRNLIAQSQNGTGKTGAFALALLSNLDPSAAYTEAVVLAPTYELASQTKSVIDKMATYMPGMTTILGIKGIRLTPGTKITEKIVIGTPGTISDWISKFRFFDSKLIKMFVLDEADVMISQCGHLSMCSRIKSMLPKDCQSLLFSATYPASVCSFANFSVPNPTIIRVKSNELTLESVKQYYTYVVNQDEQFAFAWNLFTTICIAQCIIFCDTRIATKNLASRFISCGFKTSIISGEQSVEDRAAVIDRLRKGKDKVLIATNVIARGIDISTTSLIINFDIPVEYNTNRKDGPLVPNFETYLHRVGRAGRFGVKGICVTVAKSEQDIELLSQIQAYYNHEIKPIHPWNADQLQALDPIKYAMEHEFK